MKDVHQNRIIKMKRQATNKTIYNENVDLILFLVYEVAINNVYSMYIKSKNGKIKWILTKNFLNAKKAWNIVGHGTM